MKDNQLTALSFFDISHRSLGVFESIWHFFFKQRENNQEKKIQKKKIKEKKKNSRKKKNERKKKEKKYTFFISDILFRSHTILLRERERELQTVKTKKEEK